MQDAATVTRSTETLQARRMDSEIYRQMRMECASRTPRIALHDLIAEMWEAYRARKVSASNGSH